MPNKKRLSEYGIALLDDLEEDRSLFRSGDMEVDHARTIATMANATSTALRTSLSCKKFETEL